MVKVFLCSQFYVLSPRVKSKTQPNVRDLSVLVLGKFLSTCFSGAAHWGNGEHICLTDEKFWVQILAMALCVEFI